MAEVNLTVNGAQYEISCEPGQEVRLQELGVRIDGKVNEIRQVVGQAGQSRLFLMAALMMLDEAESGVGAAPPSSAEDDDIVSKAQDYVADVYDQLAGRLDKISTSLEKASVND
jgi:cell division protein ZapA